MVVVAVAGIVGGSATPAIQYFFSERTRKDDARNANLRAIIVALYEMDDWLEKFRARSMFGEKNDLPLSPQATVESLARVHFPGLTHSFTKFDYAVAAYKTWCTERALERANGKPLLIDGYDDIIQSLTLAKSNFIAEMCGRPTLTPEQAFGRRSAAGEPK